jgi:hypothetical protein
MRMGRPLDKSLSVATVAGIPGMYPSTSRRMAWSIADLPAKFGPWISTRAPNE